MNEKSTLKPDEIRKIIWGLSLRRAKLQNKLFTPHQMIEGCIHKIYKKCGNPKCYCVTGKKHGPYWAISKKTGGKTKITYISDTGTVKKAFAYKKYNKDLATLRKINEKIYYWLRILRDKNTVSYEK
ncbi:MAG: hypothetical protein E3J77_04005 [Actinobacteria bacterium]|nr:MAG: hypothetical protein E3J77_04005 [Actinomycetota bacterium]